MNRLTLLLSLLILSCTTHEHAQKEPSMEAVYEDMDIITVKEDGRIFFQNQEMTFEQINKLRTKSIIGIKAYPQTSYQDFIKVVRYAERTGRRIGTNIILISIIENK